MRTYPALILALALMPTLAMASPQMDANSARAQRVMQVVEQKFTDADADHDGKLTLSEAKAGMPRVAQHFDEIDTDHHGYITLEQIKAFALSHAGG